MSSTSRDFSSPLAVVIFEGSPSLALNELLDFREQALCLLTALDIQVQKLCRIVLDMADLDRLLRSNDQRAALALILPQVHALDVVTVVARLDSLEQIGVVGITRTRGRQKLVGLFLIRTVLRDNDNRAIEARLLEHMLDGNRIGYAAVDVFVPVNLDRRRHQRQRRRGANSVEVKYGAFDREVRGGSKEHVVATAYISMGLASNVSLSKGSRRSWTSLKIKS